MVPEDVYELAWAGDPRISPDGSTVAFTVTRIDREANDYRSAIYLAPADRSTPPRRLTSGEKRDDSPRWSPDGRELAFASNRDGDCSQLYVLPLRGGEARRLTDTKESVREPAWSPDGTRLAFVARTRDPLYEEEDEGKRAPHRFTRLFFKFDDEGWTGDRRQQVYVVASDGSTEPVQLTEGDFESMSPTWSPDSEWIAFSSARDDDWDTRIFSDLFVVAADGGAPRKVTGSDGQCAFPAWSPDGALLAFLYVPGIFDDPRHAQLTVVPAKGGEQRILSASLDRNCNPYPPVRVPAWDGDAIVFAVEDHGNNDLYRASADGSSCDAILRGIGVTGFDAAGGDFVYTASTPTTLLRALPGRRADHAADRALRLAAGARPSRSGSSPSPRTAPRSRPGSCRRPASRRASAIRSSSTSTAGRTRSTRRSSSTSSRCSPAPDTRSSSATRAAPPATARSGAARFAGPASSARAGGRSTTRI